MPSEHPKFEEFKERVLANPEARAAYEAAESRADLEETLADLIHPHMRGVRDRHDYLVGPASQEAAEDVAEFVARIRDEAVAAAEAKRDAHWSEALELCETALRNEQGHHENTKQAWRAAERAHAAAVSETREQVAQEIEAQQDGLYTTNGYGLPYIQGRRDERSICAALARSGATPSEDRLPMDLCGGHCASLGTARCGICGTTCTWCHPSPRPSETGPDEGLRTRVEAVLTECTCTFVDSPYGNEERRVADQCFVHGPDANPDRLRAALAGPDAEGDA